MSFLYVLAGSIPVLAGVGALVYESHLIKNHYNITEPLRLTQQEGNSLFNPLSKRYLQTRTRIEPVIGLLESQIMLIDDDNDFRWAVRSKLDRLYDASLELKSILKNEKAMAILPGYESSLLFSDSVIESMKWFNQLIKAYKNDPPSLLDERALYKDISRYLEMIKALTNDTYRKLIEGAMKEVKDTEDSYKEVPLEIYENKVGEISYSYTREFHYFSPIVKEGNRYSDNTELYSGIVNLTTDLVSYIDENKSLQTLNNYLYINHVLLAVYAVYGMGNSTEAHNKIRTWAKQVLREKIDEQKSWVERQRIIWHPVDKTAILSNNLETSLKMHEKSLERKEKMRQDLLYLMGEIEKMKETTKESA